MKYTLDSKQSSQLDEELVGSERTVVQSIVHEAAGLMAQLSLFEFCCVVSVGEVSVVALRTPAFSGEDAVDSIPRA